MRQLLWLIACLAMTTTLPLGTALAASAATGLPDFTAVVSRVSAVVVNVSAVQPAGSIAQDGVPDASSNSADITAPDWYRRYFGASPPDDGAARGDQNADTPETESLGSGFIISSDGEILTNYHVVAHAESISVKLSDRRVLPSRILGVDPQSDLALVKIRASGLPVARVSTRAVRVGQWVLAIGSPFGFDHSVTAGIVSAEGRSISDEQYVPYIQTDVPINPGNSGGPLFNLQGQVVGINSEIYSGTGGYQGVSFAIPMNLAMQVVRQLRQQGHVTRGWLGVSIVDVDPDLAQTLHLARPEGALVRKVMAASPAAQAGLKAGDVILAYDGMNVVSSESLPPLVGATVVGHDVPVTVFRDSHLLDLKVRVGQLPASVVTASAPGDAAPDAQIDALGLATRSLTPDERRQFRLNQGGVVIERVAQGAAQLAGFKPGDVVLMLNGTPVIGPQQFLRLEKLLPDRPVPVLVRRPNLTLFLALQAGGS
jgi:serine protease Do